MFMRLTLPTIQVLRIVNSQHLIGMESNASVALMITLTSILTGKCAKIVVLDQDTIHKVGNARISKGSILIRDRPLRN